MNYPTFDNEWSTIGKVGAFCTGVALLGVAWILWPAVLRFLP